MAKLEKNTLQEWGLLLSEFEQGSWGATAGKQFLPPLSAQKRFVSPTNTNTYLKEDLFNEVAQVYMTMAINVFPILKAVPLGSTDEDGYKIYKDMVRDSLKEAVFRGIQFACENKNVWERVTGASLSTASFSANVETTGWIFSSSAWGHMGWVSLENSLIDKYELCDDGTIIFNGFDGNEIIAKGWLADQKLIDKIVAEIKAAAAFKLDVSLLGPDQIIASVSGTLEPGLVGPQGPAGPVGAPGAGINFKGEKPSEVEIRAITDAVVGDAWLAQNSQELWVFSSEGWIDAGAFQGPRGVAGRDGAQGIQGPEGPRGSIGAEGPQGVKGDKGDTGPQGPKGDQGEKGDRGDRGIQGPKGDQGADGRSFQIMGSRDTAATIKTIANPVVGDGYIALDTEHLWGFTPTGWQDLGNLSGPQGRQGDQGATGPAGPKGDKGDKGDTGAQGPQGQQGIQGPRGLQGPKGDTGPQGTAGTNGVDGAPGERGPRGLQGAQGPKGDKGDKGDPGITTTDVTITYEDGTTQRFKWGL